MAKNKKEMTPEERLAAALVPEEEQPYELPEGWKWVYGTGFFLPMETEYPTGDSFRYIDIESIDNSVQRVRCPKNLPVKKAPSRASRKLHIGDTLFSMVRPYLKNIAYIDEEYSDCIGSTGFYVCTPTPLVDRHYLYWLMVSPFVVNGLNHFMKGDNSPSIRKGDIEKFVYPIPPLSEQHRLVARIESLFAKLDAAKEKVQSVLDSHETRKAALLHDAFAGKLTAKWREERGIPQSWKNGKLLDCLLEKPRNGYSPKAVNYPTKCKSMSLSATTDGIFKKEYYKYIDEEIPADSYLWLEPGDILIQRSNSLEKVGISAIYTGGTHEYIYPDLMMKLQVNNQNDPAYINYFLQRAETRAYFLSNATGIAGNMPKINQKTVSNTPVNYPSLTEQQEIVRILDRLLAREQRARQAAEETLTAIDRMKQAILARAFRGEL